MKRTVPLLILALGGCRGARSVPVPAGLARSVADTIDVLEAVWRVPASEYTGAGVRSLYLPGADSGAVTASDAVRAALIARGVRVATRRPTGHDTVVYQVTRWARDSAGRPLLSVSSRWTRMSTSAPSICISAGNAETYLARRTPAGWEAERIAPGLHGVGYC
jgi:hypothetical protein